ncbi:hypothetical protein SI65_02218 [Aspergillus cristatus]|uniref:Uncharacterized protein n=1 Tax=Aspergillus cristatus TaxID=573508 RepID=A0A1E3BK83_ASPCR|nr:hypothetical protein SI65_02218 [Aspergillus cristatus]
MPTRRPAISCDPSCAIAYWGLAFSLGPNYNKEWRLFDQKDLKVTTKRTYDASRKAKEHIENASPIERALIDAIQARYQTDSPVSMQEYALQNRAYADSMESVYREFGDDLDPTPGARTLEAKTVLEQALKHKNAKHHPGLLHLYIHMVEMSPNPEHGLNAADHLRDLVPDAGHLRHMPSHLDMLVGDYRRDIASNYQARIADEEFLRRRGVRNLYSFYRMHDYQSLIYAAMFAGKKDVALEMVDQMEGTLPDIESPPLTDWLETFKAVRFHVMIRFGMWDELTRIDLPSDQNLYCVTTATAHYAKGVAWAALGNIQEAERERTLFHESLKHVSPTRLDFPVKCVDILAVGVVMLDGEIKYRRGNYKQAFEHLRKSVDLDDGLDYSEPWGWMQPARHAYAALLLEQGHLQEAADVYKADLGLGGAPAAANQHPNNVWALQGYHECLTRLGRTVEADLIKPQLKVAVAVADIPILSSCFYRVD